MLHLKRCKHKEQDIFAWHTTGGQRKRREATGGQGRPWEATGGPSKATETSSRAQTLARYQNQSSNNTACLGNKLLVLSQLGVCKYQNKINNVTVVLNLTVFEILLVFIDN